MLKRIKRYLLTLTLLVLGASQSFAQCAMCRGSVESSVSAGDTSMAANLNLGILYLFFAPYVLAAVIAYIWYKASKKNVKKTQATGSFAG
ncbi:MAG: hypothetical protein JJ978_01815 [Roseivirga sp.]|uniref:hypothetical protein n=1 Tax=Roseivirga sp. TaxID=1964215 RepID=UPI001AFD90DC|nr:hypothetical protein [Roseivirga sp.]MBO6494275.1 hypothetical protein [Roseivirga sp.]